MSVLYTVLGKGRLSNKSDLGEIITNYKKQVINMASVDTLKQIWTVGIWSERFY